MAELQPLMRVLGRVRSRVRTQHVLQGLAIATGAGMLVLAAGLLAERLQAPWLRPAAWLAGGTLLAGGLVGGLWPVSLTRAAGRLDRTHDLKGRLRSSLEFASAPAPTPFMQATLQETQRRLPALSPARAAPIRWPGAIRLLPVPAVLLLLAAVVPLPGRDVPPDPPQAARVVNPVQLDDDTLRAFRQDLAHIRQTAAAPDAEAAGYERLLDALERGEIDRDQALRGLEALQRQLTTAGQRYTRIVKDGLARMARGMGDGRLTDALVEALASGDPAEAAAALEELSRRLAAGELDAKQRQALREALEQAARAQDRDTPAEPQLLNRDEPPPDDDPEPSLLRDPEEDKRQLEELRREQEAGQRAQRQLEELRRELERAGAQGGADGSGASESMEQAARQLREMAGDGLNDAQRRKLEQQMQQLREQLQRQGRSQPNPEDSGEGESQQQRLERFRLQAGGGEGAQGAGIAAPGSEDSRQGDGGTRDGGAGMAGADGGDGDGPDGGRRSLQLGGEGEPNASLEMPGPGGSERRSERRASSGAPESPEPTPRPDAQHEDSHVAGVATRGPSRSQVILGAADQGFSSAPYQQVYGEYREHAESVLERDEIPPGYRFYVRRYFQLIRPREGSENE